MVGTNKVAFVLVLVSIISCGPRQEATRYNGRDILGVWKLKDKEQLNYPTLDFKPDSIAILTSRGDTVYRWKYLVQGDSLILFDVYNAKKAIRIDHLDSVKLVFNDLLEEKGKQLYFKVE
jgi:hypothetical protein